MYRGQRVSQDSKEGIREERLELWDGRGEGIFGKREVREKGKEGGEGRRRRKTYEKGHW